MSLLALRGVGHAFFGRAVLEGIDLEIGSGEVVTLLGPSGSGKSTIAHIAAGLIDQQEGRVVRSYTRHAMVFQEPRLLHWATVGQNIAFPLRLARTPRRGRAARVEQAAIRAGLLLEDLAKFPVELSGGMRQRTAIARALVNEPDFIYFDEPFTALDVALKRRMQDLVIEASSGGQFGALFITHDVIEAIRISHRILVLAHDGRGIVGERRVPGSPGGRSEEESFRLRQEFLKRDPLFAHIHEIDERARP